MSTAIDFWKAIDEELGDLGERVRPVKAYVGSEVNGRVSLRFPGQAQATEARYPKIAGPQLAPDTPVYCLRVGDKYLVLGRVSDGTWDGGGGPGGGDHPAVTVSDTSSIDLTIDASQHLTAAAKFGTSAGTVAEGNHTHDSRYYTESEVDTKLAGKANTSHSHAIGDVSGLQSALDGKAASSHSHAISQVTGLQSALDGKASTDHAHAAVDVTDFDEASFDALVDALQAGSNVTLSVDTNARTITIAANGGGGAGIVYKSNTRSGSSNAQAGWTSGQGVTFASAVTTITTADGYVPSQRYLVTLSAEIFCTTTQGNEVAIAPKREDLSSLGIAGFTRALASMTGEQRISASWTFELAPNGLPGGNGVPANTLQCRIQMWASATDGVSIRDGMTSIVMLPV